MSALSPAPAIDRLRVAFGRPVDHDTPHRSHGPHRLREEIDSRLAAGPVTYPLEVSVAAGGDDPILLFRPKAYPESVKRRLG